MTLGGDSMEEAKREVIYRDIFESGKDLKEKSTEENHILKL